MTEDNLRRAFFLRSRIEGVRLFRRHVALVQKGPRTFSMGLVGQADAYGFVRSEGRFAIPFEVEFKNRRGKRSDEQIAWAEFCASMNVPYLLLDCHAASSVDEIVAEWLERFASFVRDLRSRHAAR